MPHATNDYLLLLGIITCVCVPAITFFDDENFKVLHGIIASGAFLGGAFYANALSKTMIAHRKLFDLATQTEIATASKLAVTINATLGSFLMSMTLYGSGYWSTSMFEWLLTFQIFNYFALTSFTNSYYQTVHPYATLKK